MTLKASLVTLALLTAGAAHAVSFTWTISGLSFTDGATVSGSFGYDATTNTYSPINVSVTGGSAGPATFIAQHPLADATTALFVAGSGNLTGVRIIAIYGNNPLTNAAGTRTVNVAEGTCGDPTCTTAPAFRNGGPGTLTAAAQPPPPQTTGVPAISTAGMALLVLLLAGMAIYAMRHTTPADTL
jgi:hypothetical protein